MMTAEQVLEVVNNLGRAGQHGRAAAIRRSNTTAMHGSTLTLAQQRLLTDAEAVPVAPRLGYAHPAATARSAARVRGDKPLTPSELAWLQRLPADPTQIPHADATRLITLLQSVTSADDATLVRSIAAPVLEHHDGKQAEVDLANAQAPLVPAPASALPALADAIRDGHDQLMPDEILGRASTMMTKNGEQRRTQQAQRAADAQQTIDAVRSRAADRTAVHR